MHKFECIILYPKPQASISISENISKCYHSQKRETPVVTYTSLLIYTTVRSETLIGKLFHLGLCILYKRVLEITKDMTEHNLQQSELKVFITKHSYKNLFAVVAKDDIDLNASSTTAKDYYPGTSLSMLSFPSKEVPG